MTNSSLIELMPKVRDNASIRPARARPLWLWFVTGFWTVFLVMSLTIRMHSMLPSGDAVIGCKLWQYYILEFERALHSSGYVGPASGSTSAAVETAFEHVLTSAAGGAVMLGIGWAVRKFNDRRRGTA
jgi:bacteriorhodopsin